MINRRCFLAFTGALAASNFLPGTMAQAMAATRRTFSYGPAKLDISSPAGVNNKPILVYVHGGGWRTGSRTHAASKPEFFNRLGMIFVSIDYRLIPQVSAATQANDVAQAIDWVKANAHDFGGNPSKIAVMGHSAGAHLAALAVLSGNAPRVAALMCNDSAAYDLPALAAAGGGALPDELAAAFPDEALWPSLSPISYVGSRSHSPCLILWSNSPRRERFSSAFVQKLRAAGTSTDIFSAPGLSHEQINKRIGSGSAPALDAAIEGFLRQL